jgi:hypothetical protein
LYRDSTVRVPRGTLGPPRRPGAATEPGEDQVFGVVAWGELAADRPHHQGREGNRTDAGVALRAGFEAAAEPAGLIPGGADLEHGDGPVEVNAAAAQPGQLAEAQAGAEQAGDVVPPEQREAGQQPPGLLRS